MNRYLTWPILCVAVCTSVFRYPAQAADESAWFRWRPAGGMVQHIVSNDSDAPRKLLIASRFHGECKSNDLPSFSKDPRSSFVTATIELKPHTWAALYTPIAEREVGCTVNLLLAKLEGDAERLSSVKLTADDDRVDYLPFDSGEVVIDTSVVRDDLVHAFEPAGTSIQVQVRARNRSAETRMVAITRRRLDCGADGTYDWMVGPGEAPVEISTGPTIVKPNGTVVFSQRLRGSGDYKSCKVSFTLSDARRTAKIKEQIDEPPRWVDLKEVSVPLSSAQVMGYR